MSNPYFSSYKYKNSDYGLHNGEVKDIVLGDGSGPFTVKWVGSNGYASPTYTGNPSTDLTGLSAGTYTGTTIASGLTGTTILTIKEKVQVVMTTEVTDDSCKNGGCSCKIKVTDFVHDVNNFRYELYADNVLTKTYDGVIGGEVHEFSGLCSDIQYKIVGYETDETYYAYSHVNGCDTGIETITDPVDILSKWHRVSPYAPHRIDTLGTKWYNDSIKGKTLTDLQLEKIRYQPSGLQPDGTIITNDPKYWLYTGGTSDYGSYYSGTTNKSAAEGDDIGIDRGSADKHIGCFYYNTN